MSWITKITSINLATIPGVNQLIYVSYREGGTASAFSPAGTITCAPTGAIVSTPSPFVIASIPDAWASIDVQYVNQCNGIEVFQTFIKPE